MDKKPIKGNRVVRFYKSLVDEFRQDKVSFFIYISLRAIVTAIGILQFLNGSYQNALLCVFTLILFLLPAFVQKTFNVELPSTLEIIVLIFIFAAEILGELAEYYVKFSIWDTMLHTTTGFLAAAIGLSLIDLLNRSDRFKIKLSPFFVALVSFCFSMTVGVLWEFFEFAMDVFFRTDMQKDSILHVISSVALHPDGKNTPVILGGITDVAVNGESLGLGGYLDIGLYDTMKDLVVNFIGAVVFSVIGYFYTKYPTAGRGAKVVNRLKITKKENKDET
ncbi:MAG: hypothetical protein IJX64_03710 [Clostridia bacterium]|nr:hypothetical protein [Clostridia bacterium]